MLFRSHPEPESGQASGINGARFYWDGLTSIGVKFPCQSLLTNPDSYSQGDRDRRAQVRSRAKEYNAVLSAECAKVLRCRFDGNRLFDLTSNRVTPPDGPLLPQAQWAFTDLDISRNTADLCPIPGLVGGGCGDHFHPSKQGQGKIADSATAAGRNWTDTTMPTAGATVLPSGVNRRKWPCSALPVHSKPIKKDWGGCCSICKASRPVRLLAVFSPASRVEAGFCRVAQPASASDRARTPQRRYAQTIFFIRLLWLCL